MVRAIKLVTVKFLQSKNTVTISVVVNDRRVACYTFKIIITALLFCESNACPVRNISANFLIQGILTFPQQKEYFDRKIIQELIF